MFGQAFGFKEFKTPFARCTHGLHALKAFKHFDTRLSLTGFRSLVAESIDEALEVSAFTFVSFGGCVLLTQAFDSHGFKSRVVTAVTTDGFIFD